MDCIRADPRSASAPNEGDTSMWYFAWILGTGLASTVAILNGMWFESRERNRLEKENSR